VIPTLPQWFTFGKLRAAYAEVGSDTDVGPYANSLYYRIDNNLFPNSNGQLQPVGIINASTVPNPGLKPMRVSEMEFGLDLKFFDNRVGLDVAYYDKTTSDQILQAQISDASGYTNRLINVGKSRNKGVEMLVSLVPIRTSSFEWSTSFNGSYNESEVLKLLTDTPGSMITMGDGVYIGELRQVVGKPLGQLFGWGYKRDDQGRVVHDNSGRPVRSDAQLNFGSAVPVWVGGFSNTFNYRGINLSFLIDFKLGHKLISGTNHNAWRHGLHKGSLPGREENAVVGVGVNQNGEVNTTPSTSAQVYYETVRGLRIAEGFVYDAGFWKLRQVTLGYDFTRFLPGKLFVKGLRVNAVANNVAILKKWVDNIDPESFGFSSDNLVGLESTGLPTTRSVGFNLNVRF
jgi:outer membrane receptor protein involved in Fe transport